MPGKNAILNRYISAVADINEAAIGRTMVSLAGNTMRKPIHNYIGTPDRNITAVIGVLRCRFIGNGGKTVSRDAQGIPVYGKRSDVCDLIKVPDDRRIHIYFAVPVYNKDICLG